ncbi:ribonuclease VapC30 [Variibacter gotjawalensis]|uniref:Ribonuclease VapC n=1 Tax=Variibacter gotjawalensis TaxID=1333996 RepID=A0A0S3PNZ4_9BRAD|nr:type II toxin-antitoxin system VapC family toxin [Variibacter gotjawalensis]NIK47951.1 ribonuclease VapC [Variibacter gotjawalensis]RZS49829.1 ribonuclease VapC [Variibacter gotjawalensis]BAT57658.1 ribonuclease VapC30 [Variibacter gotjawalensis]
MFVDASAIVAILSMEPERSRFIRALSTAETSAYTSVIAVWEAVTGVQRKLELPLVDAERAVHEFIEASKISIVAVAPAELSAALSAFDRYGRHRFPASERNRALNLADCFHYASAKAQRVPILTKDVAFAATDLPVVSA